MLNQSVSLWSCGWVCHCTTGTRLLCQPGCCKSVNHGWGCGIHWQWSRETPMSFDLKHCEKNEGCADTLVLAGVAQRRCAWTSLSINIFLTVVAAHRRRYKYLKPQRSASWDEVFQQSRDLNSISVPHWKSLTPERKPKLFQFYRREGKCAFTRPAAWFSFPFSFISVLLHSQAVVVHLSLADFPRAPWQGLHHLGGYGVMERSDRWIFTSLTSASRDLLQMLSRLWGVEVVVFPVITCRMCSTLRHSAVPKQENFVLSLFLSPSSLPVARQPSCPLPPPLPSSSSHSFMHFPGQWPAWFLSPTYKPMFFYLLLG